jgi:hypothetical protein
LGTVRGRLAHMPRVFPLISPLRSATDPRASGMQDAKLGWMSGGAGELPLLPSGLTKGVN